MEEREQGTSAALSKLTTQCIALEQGPLITPRHLLLGLPKLSINCPVAPISAVVLLQPQAILFALETSIKLIMMEALHLKIHNLGWEMGRLELTFQAQWMARSSKFRVETSEHTPLLLIQASKLTAESSRVLWDLWRHSLQ